MATREDYFGDDRCSYCDARLFDERRSPRNFVCKACYAEQAPFKVGTYVLVDRLVGFPSRTLRCKVERAEGCYVWIRTADLLDAGTPLVVDASQCRDEDAVADQADTVYPGGMVTFE